MARRKFTEEQKLFMEEYASTLPWPELTEQFNEKFHTDFPYNTIKGWLYQHGFKSVNGTHRFTSESSPRWQKGLSKEEFFSHFSNDSLKKFNDNVKSMNIKYRKGQEIIKRGRPYIVINDEFGNNCIFKRLMRKNRYVWEQHNGPIPENHLILHLDGDVMNCDIENLICVPQRYLAQFRWNDWLDATGEVLKAAVKCCDLYYKAKDAKDV